MLFGKKPGKPEETIAEKEVRTEEVPAARPAETAESAQDARFSSRMAAVFGKMYRLIVSVDLSAGAYQIESGSSVIDGAKVPVRGKLDDLFENLLYATAPDDRDRLRNFFSRESLKNAIGGEATSVTGVFSFSDSVKREQAAGQTVFGYYSIRVDAIPGSPDKPRAIVFIKKANSPLDDGRIGERKMEGSLNWDELRARKLSGGVGTVFFEYDAGSDLMISHRFGASESTTEIKNYQKTMDLRCDWSVFHSDVPVLKKAISDAVDGKSGVAKLRYRMNGDHSAPFHWHRLLTAPAEDSGKVTWVIGCLTDIDDKVTERRRSGDLAQVIGKHLTDTYAKIYEIDMTTGKTYGITTNDEGFVLEPEKYNFISRTEKLIEDGTIHPDFAGTYRKIISPGFLKNKTLAGAYEFDVLLRPAGQIEYRWYRDTFSKLEGDDKYLRFILDATESHKASEMAKKIEREQHDQEKNRQLLAMMAGLVEFRNVESGAHIAHVSKLTEILLRDLMERSPVYGIDPEMVDIYSEAAVMHDIGKIMVPDTILNKTGRLSDEEYDELKKHTINGETIVSRINLPGQESLVSACREVTRHHHERWDGSGYPDGLREDQIPIGVQAVGLADAYDALVSERCYKAAMPHDEAIYRISRGDCGAFNPRVLESLKACKEEFEKLYDEKEGQ